MYETRGEDSVNRSWSIRVEKGNERVQERNFASFEQVELAKCLHRSKPIQARHDIPLLLCRERSTRKRKFIEDSQNSERSLVNELVELSRVTGS